MIAIDHCLQARPAAPEGYPTGEAIAFSILMSAQACHMQVEFQDGWLAPQAIAVVVGENLHVIGADDFRGQTLVGVRRAGGVAQLQQRW